MTLIIVIFILCKKMIICWRLIMVTQEQFLNDFKELLSREDEIQMDQDLLDIDEWDSFSAISFLNMIKEKYHIEAKPFAIAEAVLVEDLYNVIQNLGK